MNLHNPTPSVLTHGGKIEDGFASTLATAHAHNAAQSEVINPTAPASEYPKHVHKDKDFKVVKSAEEHEKAKADGWADYPAEIIREEKGTPVVAPNPPALGSESPHSRHMHYNEPEGEE